MPRRTSDIITVATAPGSRTRGLLRVQGRVLPCALGRSGTTVRKREGDGATPIGQFAVLRALVRRERSKVRCARVPLEFTTPRDGWCDATGDRNYNRPVTLPYGASHETLQRKDRLYDIIVVLDFNITRRMARGGSAIFFHIAKPGLAPTEGCVAVAPPAMAWLLPRLTRSTVFRIV